MKVEIFTRDSCQTCIMTKKMLVERNVPFTEYIVGHDIQREEVLIRFPEAKMLPVIIADGIYIGSKEHLSIYIDNYGDERYVGTGT